MPLRAEHLGQAQQAHTMPDGRVAWIEAKPYPPPLSWRLRDAWKVLTGEALALVWPKPVKESRDAVHE